MLLRILLSIFLCFPITVLATPDSGRIPPLELSYFVQDILTGEVIAEHRADIPMNPASVMKLVTSYAALETLGKDFRWHTKWSARAPINQGILDGNIFWQGTGDPMMEQKDIINMQEQLRQKGIHTINGYLVLDRSAWSSNGSAEQFESDEGKSFTIPPDQHMLSYKVIWIEAFKNSSGKMDVSTNPPFANIDVKKNIQTIGGKCNRFNRMIKVYWDGEALHINGKIPATCSGQRTYVNVLTSQQFAAESFIGQWKFAGGKGNIQIREGSLPENSQTLAEHLSPPLSEVIRDMNKVSDNLIARTLFLTLGANKEGDTIQNARNTVFESFKRTGVPTDSLILENGSGLSRVERISTRALGTMLYRAYYEPQFGQTFIDSLPIAGVDGTLRRRLKDVPNLTMKTGTLKNVRALAGYKLPDSEDEHPLAIAVIINSPQSVAYLSDMDNLVRSLVKEYNQSQNRVSSQL